MIRQAKVRDINSIKKLIDYGSKQGFILPRTKREIRENIDSFFLAEEDNKIVACCSLDIYSWKLAEIRSLVVLPEYQKRGIGARLVDECLKKAKKLKVYEVLSITKADKFFETLGFSKCLNDQWPMFIKITKRKGYSM